MIWVAAYGLGCLCAWRPVFRFFRDDLKPEDTSEFFMTVMLASFMFWFWPFIVVGLALRWAVAGGERDPERIALKLGGESRTAKAQRLARERRERERYMESLERELGIGS